MFCPLAKKTATEYAQTFIPALCEQLEKENPEMPKEDIKETVTRDCVDTWSKATIRKFMPDEYKDPKKQEAGRKGREIQRLEESKTEQESGRFEDADRGPDVKPTHITVDYVRA